MKGDFTRNANRTSKSSKQRHVLLPVQRHGVKSRDAGTSQRDSIRGWRRIRRGNLRHQERIFSYS